MQDKRKNMSRGAIASLFLVLAATACASNDASGARNPETVPEQEMTVNSTPGTDDDPLGCGQPLRLPANGALSLDARFPGTTQGTNQMVTGTVEVTSQRDVRGVVSQQAEMFLVRDDRVVGVPLAQDLLGVQIDLAAGEVERLPADATLISCEPDGGPVPPGDYELYARVVVTPDDGAALVSFGGPWPIQVT